MVIATSHTTMHGSMNVKHIMFEALKLVMILWGLQHQEDLHNVDNNFRFYRYNKIRLTVITELKVQSFQSKQVLFMDFSPISSILHLEWLTLTGLIEQNVLHYLSQINPPLEKSTCRTQLGNRWTIQQDIILECT